MRVARSMSASRRWVSGTAHAWGVARRPLYVPTKRLQVEEQAPGRHAHPLIAPRCCSPRSRAPSPANPALDSTAVMTETRDSVARGEGEIVSRTARMALALVVAASTMLATLGGATAQGISPEQLSAAGWTCFTDPAAPRTVCSDPGHGRPIPNDPNAPPSYNFKLFTLEGELIGTSHLIRADLYGGQPCPPTGAPYLFIPPIGYYRCEHF